MYKEISMRLKKLHFLLEIVWIKFDGWFRFCRRHIKESQVGVIPDGLDNVGWGLNFGTNYFLYWVEQQWTRQWWRGGVAQSWNCNSMTSRWALGSFRRWWDPERALSQLHLKSAHKMHKIVTNVTRYICHSCLWWECLDLSIPDMVRNSGKL